VCGKWKFGREIFAGTFNAIHPRLLLKDFEEEDHIDEDIESDVSYMTWTPEGGYEKGLKKPYPR
jgi:hypothetical protein